MEWILKKKKTYPDKDQSLTSPSPPPVAKLTASSLAPTVANGCQAAPPTFSVCPLFVEMGLRFGRSQSFVSPVQEVVRMYWEDGEKRMVDKGRSSPNWEPKLLNDCRKVRGSISVCHAAEKVAKRTLSSLNNSFRALTSFPRGTLYSLL